MPVTEVTAPLFINLLHGLLTPTPCVHNKLVSISLKSRAEAKNKQINKHVHRVCLELIYMSRLFKRENGTC